MTTFLDKLNLRPQERRWVVAVMVIVIVILNYVFIWPYFFDWGKVKTKMEEAQRNTKLYQDEIQMDANPTNGYKKLLGTGEDKQAAPQLEDKVQLYNVIMAQAQGKILILNMNTIPSRSAQTNEFFEEQSVQINVDCTEKELVEFIYGIGGDSSMIRVRDLNLRPADANRYRLKGTITLSANYQKKAEVKPAPAAKPAIGKPTLTQAPKAPTQAPMGKPALIPAPKKPAK